MLVSQSVSLCSSVILGCNAVGYLLSALLETHKLTDLVGAGSFAIASAALLGGIVAKDAIAGEGLISLALDRNPRAVAACILVILWGARLGAFFFSVCDY
jgi:predicted anti-sigma-YlaC factor YlaD